MSSAYERSGILSKKTSALYLLLYTGALLYLIFIDRAAVFGIRHNVIPLYSLYLSFKANNFYEIIGNIGVFIVPAVLLLRLLDGKLRRALALFLIFIVSIELGELLLNKGQFDVDDILLNTLGFLIGNWVYRKITNDLFFKKNAKLLNRLTGISFLVFLYLLAGIPHIDKLRQAKNQENEAASEIVYDEIAPIPPESWFLDIYLQLIKREVPMAQAVNCQYICNAINAKKSGADLSPVLGTETQAANCEYLLKMKDRANGNGSNYGGSVYATKQIVDTTAVTQALNLIFDRKFVTVAQSSNKAAYSIDGITWIAATLPSSANWVSITYGNGKFVTVAAGDSNKAAYSTNGINWTMSTLPSIANWLGVTYGNDKFVAVANGSNKAAYSTNGINWTASTLPSNAGWHNVTYGNGKFVTVAWNETRVAYSPNGINWTAASALPSIADWRDIVYGNGKFVAVTNGSNKAAYSTNGINWTASTLPSIASWFNVVY
jgi:glycopeptide antibiotics resistance protein